MYSFENISTENLNEKLKALKGTENNVQAEIVAHLSEIDKRKGYRDLGYSSLFTYCREALGYSEGSAYRRTQAARAFQTNPEVYDLIKSGKLSLCSVTEIQRVKESAVKTELLSASEGKSKLEVQAMTAVHLPPSVKKKESVKVRTVCQPSKMADTPLFQTESPEPVAPRAHILQYNFSVEVDGEFMRLYQEAKELMGHVPAADLLKRLLKEFVCKRKSVKRRSPQSKAKSKRFIPKPVKVDVRKRDGGQCTFTAADGHRCSERHGLEFDHIVPVAAGGRSTKENLRLVCRAHNQLYAERFFGSRRVSTLNL